MMPDWFTNFSWERMFDAIAARSVTPVKIAIIAGKSFLYFHGLTRAAALTYTTFLAVVPLLILLTSITIAVGFGNFVSDYLPHLLNILNLDWHNLPSRLLVLAVYLAVYGALFFLMLRGPANQRNRNDNTSGMAAVMELMRRNGEKDGVAYIIFDDEEKGKKGSKAFAKANPAVKANALIINLDCVGNGETFVFGPSSKAEANPLYTRLKTAVSQTGLNARLFPAGKAQMNSDHKSFDQGIGVCACSCKPKIG
jgi:hypothetical protein